MLFRETVILTMLVMNRQLIDFGGKHFNPARGEGVCSCRLSRGTKPVTAGFGYGRNELVRGERVCPGRFQATGEGAVLAAPGRAGCNGECKK